MLPLSPMVPSRQSVSRGVSRSTVSSCQKNQSLLRAKGPPLSVYFSSRSAGKPQEKKAKFVIATVRGDIHDIGKNIVRVLLENYGFQVIDLGKDVPPETVADTVVREHAPLCGLSALMTTTVPAMEETIKLLREAAPWCRIVVGGAVLTEDYAVRIGADRYAKDAMATVRYAEEVNAAL